MKGLKISIPTFDISPGYILKQELKSRGIKQGEFATIVGMRASHFSEVLKGTRSISDQLALRLEEELDIPAEKWLKLQALYIRQQKEKESMTIDEQSALNDLRSYDEAIDVKTLINRFDLKHYSYTSKRDFFTNELNLPKPAALQVKMSGMFRRSQKVGQDERMINTWSILAKHAVKDVVPKGKFSKERVLELKRKLASTFHTNKNTIQTIAELFDEYGIAFAIVEKVEKASIDGFSFRTNGIPAIVITCRMAKIDNLAFVIMHELGHHLLHITDDDTYFINCDGDEQTEIENEANNFATEALIPTDIWSNMPAMKITNLYVIQKECTKWALKHHLNKWIVLGRISHETGIYKFKYDNSRNIN